MELRKQGVIGASLTIKVDDFDFLTVNDHYHTALIISEATWLLFGYCGSKISQGLTLTTAINLLGFVNKLLIILTILNFTAVDSNALMLPPGNSAKPLALVR